MVSMGIENKKTLKELGQLHGTDKVTSHSYTDTYQELFEPLRNEKLKFLEIGAGQIGASHKMWRDYFPNAEIYCMDLFNLPDHQENLPQILEDYGVNTFTGNQLNKEDLQNLVLKFGSDFDVILDDGAHMSDAVQSSLGILFPHLKSGGLYIVEDMLTAIDRGNRLDQCNAHAMKYAGYVHFLETHLESSLKEFDQTGKWHSSTMDEEEKEYVADNILSYKLYNDKQGANNLCVIWKK